MMPKFDVYVLPADEKAETRNERPRSYAIDVSIYEVLPSITAYGTSYIFTG